MVSHPWRFRGILPTESTIYNPDAATKDTPFLLLSCQVVHTWCGMSNRFFVAGPLALGSLELDGPEAHHMAHVRRFGVGDLVTLFNGDGHEYEAQIVTVGKKRVDLKILEQQTPQREWPFAIHVAAALPKGDRADFLIEKLTELGATSFTPLHTERSIVKADDGKVEKLQRAVIEASKQCGRNVLLQVNAAQVWGEWCRQQSGARWLAHTVDAVPLRHDGTSPVCVALGPEGGFTSDEVALAVAAGWRVGSLGPRILRIETAALAAVVTLATFSLPTS